MKVIYKKGDEIIEKDYPGLDIDNPIIGLDPAIDFYYINEVKPINTNPDRFDLIRQKDVLTEDIHSEYPHLKTCNRVWGLVEKEKDTVITNLNESYGTYLDEQYPQVTRLNHLIEIQFGTTPERIKYISSLQDWLIACKKDRENRISAYIEKDIFPSFSNYLIKP